MRAFFFALIAALATDVALMIVHFVNQWPTSDVRVNLYVRIVSEPGQFFMLYGTVLFAAGSVVARLAGWRGLYALLGAGASALLTLMLIASRVFSLAVWMHRQEVTTDAISARVALATALLIAGFLVARRGLRRTS